MPQHDRIDPESLVPLAALYEALPGGFNAIPDIEARRATLYGMLAQMTADLPPNPNVSFEDVSVPGPAGDLALRVYRPVTQSASRPGIYFIHGGGMVLGNLDTDHLTAVMLCETFGAVVVAVEDRFKHPLYGKVVRRTSKLKAHDEANTAGIGLQTHEAPYIVSGNDLPLEVGMAFSVEPGFYDEGRHGARIEDIVVVGPHGPVVLNHLTRDLVMV